MIFSHYFSFKDKPNFRKNSRIKKLKLIKNLINKKLIKY